MGRGTLEIMENNIVRRRAISSRIIIHQTLRGNMSDQSQIVSFLDRVGVQVCKSGL